MLAFLKRSIASFSLGERILFTVSATFIVASFLIFDRENYMTLAASLIGVTSLLYNAKGNPVGQALMVIFSILYGIISYTFDYYGEIITYLGMTMPMAFFALISWLRHPYRGNRSEVAVKPSPRAGIRTYISGGGRRNGRVRIYSRVFQYGEHHTEYPIRYNKFYCRLPDIQKKSLLCARICGQ